MNDQQKQALTAVINYLWEDEQEDYDQREADDRDGHIFESLMILERYCRVDPLWPNPVEAK